MWPSRPIAAAIGEIVEALKAGGATTLAQRKLWAARAFGRTAAYDAAIAGWFGAELQDWFPPRLSVAGSRLQRMRYGENPHQHAAFYAGGGEARPGVTTARQLQGKELSYNNVADTDAAFELVAEFDPREQAAVAIIKHANPCGVAVGGDVLEAYHRALQCDPVSAFGGIVALNRTLDVETARAVAEIFTEVVIAPHADPGGGRGVRGQEEPAPARHRRPARPGRGGRGVPLRGRRLPDADPRHHAPDRLRP